MLERRWSDYVLAIGGSCRAEDSLRAAVSSRGQSLYVLGVGFDPRCLAGLGTFLNLEHESPPKIVRIELPPPSASAQQSVISMATQHSEQFNELTKDLEVIVLPYPQAQDSYGAGLIVARNLANTYNLTDISHIVVDISSLPSAIYFPVLKSVLLATDRKATSGTDGTTDMQIVVCENPLMDSNIRTFGISRADFVGGFRPAGQSEADPDATKVWVPVLGENSVAAIRAIHARIEPDAICPVLPFPAVNPRRADALVLEYQRTLFESLHVRSSDFIYSDESNPFDLYQSLYSLDRDYKSALGILGPTMVVLSEHSSKLLSLGVLLAAYERGLPIVAASADDYGIVTGVDLLSLNYANELYCLWLTGMPYESGAEK